MSEVLNLKRKNKPSAFEAENNRFDEDFVVPEIEVKRKNGAIRWLIVTAIAIVLTTVGINASDSLFGGKNKPNLLCPIEMVFVPGASGGFCVDKYEDSASSGCSFSNPANENESETNINNNGCQSVSVAGALPWRNLTQMQAINLCAKAGKRLPTSEEWFAASLGTPDKGASWGVADCQVNGNWGSQPGFTGSGNNCVSYAGAFDMIGNVWEWVKGEISDGVYAGSSMPDNGYVQAVSTDGLPVKTDPDNPSQLYKNDYLWIKNKGVRGLARGGYWSNGAEGGAYSMYAVSEMNFSGVGVGFRCVKDSNNN